MRGWTVRLLTENMRTLLSLDAREVNEEREERKIGGIN
ncbi:MAG: hypothetical protein ETSY1_39060 [Candidatus Entotheonella factor]|uniref:Uncharacterized protein n=1 Tax=Entotheonella factor TaxID=1429438 RepID=W4L5V3_ENTF1|nr:MAG: hypothetical protein ETSY1_39060 [Candidatus Entotheonella factor]